MIIAGQTAFPDASTETMEAAYDSYRGYPSLEFTLTEQEAQQIPGTTFTAA